MTDEHRSTQTEEQVSRVEHQDDRPADGQHGDGHERDLAEDVQAQARRDSADSGEHEAPDRQDGNEALLDPAQAEHFRSRWETIQTRFVDEPRPSVEQADALVAELVQQLTRTFADERASLDAHWDRDEEVSTEDLRVALTRYRSFFNRLLSA